MQTLQTTQNRAYVLGKILSKAFQLGRTALVDPVPELWNEDSIDSRIETMKFHFEEILGELAKEYASLSKEPVTPEMEAKILNAIQQGFETLMETQPGYRESEAVENAVNTTNMRVSQENKTELAEEIRKIEVTADKSNTRDSRESKIEIARETKKILEILLEKRLVNQAPKHKGIWIEEDDAMKFVKGVFDTLRYDHSV